MKCLRWGWHPAFWGSFLTAQLLFSQEPNDRCETNTNRLVVVFAATAPSADDVFSSFVRQFRAELANDKGDLCTTLPVVAPPYFATLRLTWTDEGLGADLDVVVRTRAQQTRLQRHVGLKAIPRSGWALALAIESDEMVRTGWARLDATAKTLEPQSAQLWWPAPTTELTPATSPNRIAPFPRAAVGPALALEHYRAGLSAVGVDVQGQWLGVAPFAFSGRFGLRDVLGGPPGQARAWVAGAGADIAVVAWHQRGALLSGARVDLVHVTRTTNSVAEAGSWGVFGVGTSGWLRLGDTFRLQSDLRLLVPMAHETSAGNLKGIGISSSLGLSTMF